MARSKISFSLEISNLARDLEFFLIFGPSGWRGMPTILGVNFGDEFFLQGPETLLKTRSKICRNNSLEAFAEEYMGNSPHICQTKLEMSPQIRSAEPWDQHLTQPTFLFLFDFCPVLVATLCFSLVTLLFILALLLTIAPLVYA